LGRGVFPDENEGLGRIAMSTFATITVDPSGVISWLVVGLVAGCVAGLAMKGRGLGVVGDVIVGLIGAEIGGFFFGLFVTGWVGFWGSIGVAFIGACLFIAIVRAMVPGHTGI
jgi:uncharacterized membrane protein YeaQ/YmgE (transglycosylase-associated protein family)